MPCGVGIQAAGKTPLHLAAADGNMEVIELLLERGSNPAAIDSDGNTPLVLALTAQHKEAARRLQQVTESEGVWDEARLKQKATEDRLRSLERLRHEPTEVMARVHAISGLWSREECEGVTRELGAVAAVHGWTRKRHAAYDTTDIPCNYLSEVDALVRDRLRERLFPALARLYQMPPERYTFHFRDLFFVKYEAKEGEQSGLDLHRDGSVISFNILLNPASDFDGGGTYFENENRTYSLQQGDCLTHSGKVLHAGAPITRGTRVVLVGFVDARDVA